MAWTLKKRNNRKPLYEKNCIYLFKKLLKHNSLFFSIFRLLMCCLFYNGVSGVFPVSVTEGDSVSLDTGVKTNQQQKIRWYFNNTCIALITGDLSKICTDIQCNEGTERFRDRLKLDHQTGSLTITNTRTTDSGDYHLQISSERTQTFSVTVHGFFSVSTDGVSVFVMERDSVTFHTDVETNKQSKIKWYFNGIRIALITGDQSKICTDEQCKEIFRDRLKLDHQTGSLTIMNINTTDAGVFELRISSKNNGERDRTFSFAVHDVSDAAEQDEMKKREGENVTLYTGVMSQNDLLRWYFNDTLIAEITGDQSKICTDDQCKERFRDRLKLDHQTGSLTIRDTRTTDSGEYQQHIYNNRISIIRNFIVSVNVAADRGPGLPSTTAGGTHAAVTAGAVCAAVLLLAAAVVFYCRNQAKQNDITSAPTKYIEDQNNPNEESGSKRDIELKTTDNGTSTNQAEEPLVANGTS